jgi:flagellar protein FlaG
MQPVTSTTANAAALAAAASQTVRPPQTAERPAEPAKPAAKTAETGAADIDVTQAAQRVEKFVQTLSSDLQFSVDEASGSNVVRVVDRSTQEVIRQIPSEEMLAIARALDRIQGLLIRQKA